MKLFYCNNRFSLTFSQFLHALIVRISRPYIIVIWGTVSTNDTMHAFQKLEHTDCLYRKLICINKAHTVDIEK